MKPPTDRPSSWWGVAGLLVGFSGALATYVFAPGAVHRLLSAAIAGAVGILGGSLARRTRLREAKRTKRQRPPLRLLDIIVKALWSTKTYERVFKPVIVDIHHEWRDARRRHEQLRAWWIRHVRGRFALLDVARRQFPWSVWSAIKRLVRLVFTFSI